MCVHARVHACLPACVHVPCMFDYVWTATLVPKCRANVLSRSIETMVLCAFLQMDDQDEDTMFSDVNIRSSALRLERVLLLSKDCSLYNLLQQQPNDCGGLHSSSPVDFSASAFGLLDARHHADPQLLQSKLLHLQVLQQRCYCSSCPSLTHLSITFIHSAGTKMSGDAV